MPRVHDFLCRRQNDPLSERSRSVSRLYKAVGEAVFAYLRPSPVRWLLHELCDLSRLWSRRPDSPARSFERVSAVGFSPPREQPEPLLSPSYLRSSLKRPPLITRSSWSGGYQHFPSDDELDKWVARTDKATHTAPPGVGVGHSRGERDKGTYPTTGGKSAWTCGRERYSDATSREGAARNYAMFDVPSPLLPARSTTMSGQ